MKARLLAAFAILGVLTAACSGSGSSTAPGRTASESRAVSTVGSTAAASELTVFAAASLKGALEQARDAYEGVVPGTTLTIATDSSSTLATQIEQGAPADVFLSADTTNPKKLVDAGLVEGAPVTFAGNKLTIIVPTANPAGITSPADLATPGVKVIAAGDKVPITRYATQVVDNLAQEPGYPADFATAYVANVASREDNVKAIVAKLELGEGDAGIVYVTDAKASDKVTVIDIPEAANVPATYDGVVVRASKDALAAKAFLDWFAGPDGQAILAELGFLPPPS